MKTQINKLGYEQVLLYSDVNKLTLVHRLVMTTFKGIDPDKTEVNHIDECKSNNKLSNLEWSTRSENALHSSHKFTGSKSGTSLLHEWDVLRVCEMIDAGYSQTDIGELFEVSNHAIHKISKGVNWPKLTGYV